MKRVEFKVSFVLPDDATIREAKDYIEKAVTTFKGSLKPASACDGEDDWYHNMFYLNEDTVKVTRLTKVKRTK